MSEPIKTVFIVLPASSHDSIARISEYMEMKLHGNPIVVFLPEGSKVIGEGIGSASSVPAILGVLLAATFRKRGRK
jgi:hypothetical protein